MLDDLPDWRLLRPFLHQFSGLLPLNGLSADYVPMRLARIRFRIEGSLQNRRTDDIPAPEHPQLVQVQSGMIDSTACSRNLFRKVAWCGLWPCAAQYRQWQAKNRDKRGVYAAFFINRAGSATSRKVVPSMARSGSQIDKGLVLTYQPFFSSRIWQISSSVKSV